LNGTLILLDRLQFDVFGIDELLLTHGVSLTEYQA
jgi:hypothetical protein